MPKPRPKTKNLYVAQVAKSKCPHCQRSGTDVIVYGVYEYINARKNLVVHLCVKDVLYLQTLINGFFYDKKNAGFGTVELVGHNIPQVFLDMKMDRL